MLVQMVKTGLLRERLRIGQFERAFSTGHRGNLIANEGSTRVRCWTY
jgi:hypothetical protein